MSLGNIHLSNFLEGFRGGSHNFPSFSEVPKHSKNRERENLNFRRIPLVSTARSLFQGSNSREEISFRRTTNSIVRDLRPQVLFYQFHLFLTGGRTNTFGLIPNSLPVSVFSDMTTGGHPLFWLLTRVFRAVFSTY